MFGRSRRNQTDMETMKSVDMDSDVRAAAPAVRNARKALGDITNSIASIVTNNDQVTKRTGAFTAVVPTKEENLTTEMDTENSNTLSNRSSSPIDVSDRPYMQREADNIDARDTGNPLLCTCVINDMYEWFNKVEKNIMTNTSYMTTNQPHINERMRSILTDWLVRFYL